MNCGWCGRSIIRMAAFFPRQTCQKLCCLQSSFLKIPLPRILKRSMWAALAPLEELGPLLHQQTGAQVQELAPELGAEQNLSGEHVSPTSMAGIVGALLG